ncbi:hypothetical protein NIES4071_73210 [Calothrix sp. NIES-4071]|nr:hypothetical protein NIES4071_73210 [Calothrix sp. NIES-4071]BAZ61596.1 hypothetical protein NIES4105_73160 [Calothrix sp. NIES-4105]
MKIKNLYIVAIATILAFAPCTIATAQTPVKALNAQALLIEAPYATIIKREINPGTVTFTRQNSCLLKTASYTNYLNDGTILSTPYYLAGSGQTLPAWRTEYKQPWKSQLTDYERGETKFMLLQVGHHPSIPVQVEESSSILLDAQTKCAIGAYRIFGRNLKLIRPLPQQHLNFNLQFNQGWERNFTY